MASLNGANPFSAKRTVRQWYSSSSVSAGMTWVASSSTFMKLRWSWAAMRWRSFIRNSLRSSSPIAELSSTGGSFKKRMKYVPSRVKKSSPNSEGSWSCSRARTSIV